MSKLPHVYTIRYVDGQPYIEAPREDHLQAPFRKPLAPLIEAEDKIWRRVDELKRGIAEPLITPRGQLTGRT